MRKGYTCLISLWMTLEACTDHSFRSYTASGQEEAETIPVMLIVGDPSYSLMFKGAGAIAPNEGLYWENSCIYVYSFKRDLTTDFQETSAKDPENCLVDGSVEKPGFPGGKKARLNSLDTYISWEEKSEKVCYPPTSYGYDFYSYYLDDLGPATEDYLRTTDGIQVKVKIDGSQDLMSAKARLTAQQTEQEGISGEEREQIQKYYYSIFTARRNIVPILYFKHHLVRLRFEIYPGSRKANNVYVDSIAVASKTRGIFTVAHKSEDRMGIDFTADTHYEYLALREKGGLPLENDRYHTDYWGDYSEPVFERESVQVGESLLVAPDEGYKLRIYLKEWLNDTGEGQPVTGVNYLNIQTTEAQFLPGRQYSVRIAVYGLQNVQVEVSPEPWGDGGDINVDEDESFIKIN